MATLCECRDSADLEIAGGEHGGACDRLLNGVWDTGLETPLVLACQKFFLCFEAYSGHGLDCFNRIISSGRFGGQHDRISAIQNRIGYI